MKTIHSLCKRKVEANTQ